MGDDYTIGLAKPSHLATIPRIEQAAAGMFPARDLPLHLRYRVTEDDVLRQAQEEERLWTVLDRTARAVGFALAEEADGQAYLSEIDVHPDHTRRGLGSRLVGAVVEWAGSQGYDSVFLVTFRHLPWNAPFYEKLGFIPMSPRDLGPEMREFIREEAAAGLDPANRIGMRLSLRQRPAPS